MSKPSTVVVTVRCDIRYTADEYAIYREIVRLWGDNSIKDNLLVAFTFGDCQDEPIEEELKTVCPELQSVLRDAGHRYFVFDKTSEQCRSGAAYTVMDLAQRMRKRGGGGEGRFRQWWGSPPFGGWPLSSRVIGVLVGALVIAVILCILFIVLGITGAAIGFGVLGLVLVVVVLLAVCGKKNSQSLLLL